MKRTNIFTILVITLTTWVAQASNYYWDNNTSNPSGTYTSTSGSWGVTNNTWQDASGNHVVWPNSGTDNNAFITGGSGTLTNTSDISIHNLSTEGASGTWNISGGTSGRTWTLNGADGNFNVTNARTVVFGGAAATYIYLSGTANVQKWGAGTLQFQGLLNTFTGDIYVHQGNFQCNGDGSLGNPANNVYMENNGGFFQNTGSGLTWTNRNFYIGPSGGSFPMNSKITLKGGGIQNWSGHPNWVGTPGVVNKSGSAVLILQCTNNFSGQFIISGVGGLTINASGNAGGAGFSLSNLTTLTINQDIAGITMPVSSMTNLAGAAYITNSFTFGANSNPSVPVMYVTNLSLGQAGTIITYNVSGTGLTSGQFPLIKYQTDDGTLGNCTFLAGSMPVGYVGYISNNVSNKSIDVVLTSPQFLWGAMVNNNWDTSTVNWTNLMTLASEKFLQGGIAVFDDSAASQTVNVVQSVSPGGLIVSNVAQNYVFQSGGGSIDGSGQFVKLGSGTVTVQTSNSYSGNTIISNGTYVVGAVGAIPTGSSAGIVQNYGTLNMNGYDTYIVGLSGSGVITNTGPSGTTNIFSIAGYGSSATVFSGVIHDNPSGGAVIGLIKTNGGSLTISTPQDYSGYTWLRGGTVILGADNVFPTNVLFSFGAPNLGMTLDCNGYSQAYSGINGTGSGSGTKQIKNSSSTPIVISLRVPSGVTDVYGHQMNGAISIEKEGGGLQELGGVSTYTGTITVNNGTLLVYNHGAVTNTATVNASGTFGGIGTFGGPVIVNMGGTLVAGANTSINSIVPDGSPMPGTPGIGVFSITNTVTLSAGSKTFMVISGGSAVSNSVVTNITTLTLGGTLVVTNIGADALIAGNSFQLFSADNFVGDFQALNLPSLGAGLMWDTSALATNGIIAVIAQPSTPATVALSFSGGNFIFSVTGGAANSVFNILSATNLTTPLADWTPVYTNTFDSNGDFSGTNIIQVNMAVPKQFYILSE